MAASLGKNSKFTLSATQLIFLKRFKSTKRKLQVIPSNTTNSNWKPQILTGNTWYVFEKPSRKREILTVDVEKPDVKGDVKEIKIPDKIERSPTAILEALASTVKNNTNQPFYKSIDDPSLYILSDKQRKERFAAMDSGHKAAQMMISLYSEYFTPIWEDPLPESLRDTTLGYKFQDPSEDALLERIQKLAVEDAINVYNSLMTSKTIPSQETQEKLLELLTVFNCQSQESVSDLNIFITNPPLSKNAPFPASTWQKGNMAEQVFSALPSKTAKAYCHMIRGMAANYDKQGALEMYNEMKTANLTADVYTYNKLLSVASLDTQTVEEITQFVEIILNDMAKSNIRPNTETFNSILCNCRRLSRWSGSKKYALSVLSEMKACGIEPNISTYWEIIQTFYYHKDKTPKNPALFENILSEIEGKEFKCTSETDAVFFRTAMNTIATHFPDSKLALRLHKIFQTGKNSDFLGHRQFQFTYYNDLFTVITPLEHIDVVMEIFTSVVPFLYAPVYEVYKAILESIEMHDAYKHVPVLYAELQFSSLLYEQDFVEIFTRTLAKQKNDPKLQAQLCDIATSFIKRWLETKDLFNRGKIYMDGSIIGNLIIVFLNGDQLKKAWELFQLYLDESQLKAGDPSESSLIKLTEHLIAEKDYSSTKKVLDHMQVLGYDGIPAIVEKVLQTFTLSDQERNYLQSLAADSKSSSSSSSDSD